MIDIRITRARAALVMAHPFFGALAMRLIVAERADIRTLATDGIFLFYCRKFLDTISDADLLFCVAHEVLHCALSHMTRRNGREWPLWQAATDYAVNLMLHDAGFKVPGWVKYFDQKYRGLNVEQIYQLLEQEQQKQQQDQKQDQPQPQPQAGGQGGQDDQDDQEGDDQCTTDTAAQDAATQPGSGEDDTGAFGTLQSESAQDGNTGASSSQNSADGEPSESSDGPGTPSTTNYAPAHGDPGGCGEVLDAAPPHDQAAIDNVASEWQIYTRQAANVARRQGEGKLPGFIEELVAVLDKPQTDWREALRQFVAPSSNTKDYSWTHPNRRMMGLGFYVPGMISDGINHMAILVDSSISIDFKWLQKFGGEAQAALDEGAIDKITLVFIDEKVHRTAKYTKGDLIDFTVQGRGGTRFAPAFEWVNENANDVAGAIYFTDLDCSDFGPEPSYPVLWAAYDANPRALKERMDRVPFGSVVELKQ